MTRLTIEAQDELWAWYQDIDEGQRMAFWTFVNADNAAAIMASLRRGTPAYHELIAILIRHGLVTWPGSHA